MIGTVSVSTDTWSSVLRLARQGTLLANMIAEWWVRRWNWEMREERGGDGVLIGRARVVVDL